VSTLPHWNGEAEYIESIGTIPAGRRYGDRNRFWYARSDLPGRPWLRIFRRADGSGWWV
jgi:hypothetical protein